jgi:hypothetical protein
MKGKRNVLLTAVVLLLVTHRLPAPITEIPESPTPALSAAPEQTSKPKAKRLSRSFAGKWTGTLRIETQDSYRGNNAKGQHRVSSELWIFDISADQKIVSFHRAAWKGPPTRAAVIRTSEDTLTWVEKTTASASVPIDFYNANRRKTGTGTGIRPDYDATWTMHAISDTTASLVCKSNTEDIYARITDARITGTLKRN